MLTAVLNAIFESALTQVIDASAPSIVIPPPLAAAESAAPLAISKFLSSILSVAVLS